ncbi:HNH endonuclease signature motif containing protein [Photobacterium leiognathi subsp. mandapamensis]|uniref:HNH endonuclease signature motif containing protein n=1 Tax=Photobacterium leiognathi TaxID=553611 RepID=UPI003AF3610E
MAKRQFITEDMKVFLRKYYPEMDIETLTKAFNQQFSTSKTPSQIKSTLSNYKIRCGRKTSSIMKGKNRILNNEQVAFLRQTYRKYELKETVERLNANFGTQYTFRQIRSFVKNHQIQCGRTGHFTLGQVPHNAGTKGVMKANKTSFKPGYVRKQLPIGTERINVQGYIEVKVIDPNTWRLKHRVVWEQHYGPLNKDDVVRFRDGNRTNLDIDNLFVVDRTTHAIINNSYKFNDQPNELKDSVILLAKIDAKLGKLK